LKKLFFTQKLKNNMGAKCSSAAEARLGQNARVKRVQFGRNRKAFPDAPESQVVWTVSTRQGVISKPPADECNEIALYAPNDDFSDASVGVLPSSLDDEFLSPRSNNEHEDVNNSPLNLPPTIEESGPLRISLPIAAPMTTTNRDDLTAILASAYFNYGGYTESESEGPTDWAAKMLKKTKKRRGFRHTLPEVREGEESEWSSPGKNKGISYLQTTDTEFDDSEWYSKKNASTRGDWSEDFSSGPGSSSDESKKQTKGRVPIPTGTAAEEADFDWLPTKGGSGKEEIESDSCWYPQKDFKMQKLDGITSEDEDFYTANEDKTETRGQEKVGEDTAYEFKNGEESVYESDEWQTSKEGAERSTKGGAEGDFEETAMDTFGGEPSVAEDGNEGFSPAKKSAEETKRLQDEEDFTVLVQGLFLQLAAMGATQGAISKTTPKGPSAPPKPSARAPQRTHVPRHVTRGSLQTPRPIMTPGFAPYSNPAPSHDDVKQSETRGSETDRETAGSETKAKKVASEEEVSQAMLEELISEDMVETYHSTMTTPTGEVEEEGKMSVEDDVLVQSVAVTHVEGDAVAEGEQLLVPGRELVNYGVLTDGGLPEGENETDDEEVVMLSISENL